MYQFLETEFRDPELLRCSDSELTLGDSDGRSHIVPKSRIERRLIQSASTMPQGLERQLSDQEFIDLIAFLSASR